VAATSISLTGLALIVSGVVLMVLRRRRDKITFTS
jgi:LPXTG-motif cell wall-anchored protein